jgi:hypothetical protein
MMWISSKTHCTERDASCDRAEEVSFGLFYDSLQVYYHKYDPNVLFLASLERLDAYIVAQQAITATLETLSVDALAIPVQILSRC